MIGIVHKTHPLYLLIEVAVLAVVAFAACFFLSMNKATTETSTIITNVDNFSNAWVFTLPQGHYGVFSVKQIAKMTYKTTQDLDTWPFTVDVFGYFGAESTEDRFIKLNTKARETELYQEIPFFNQNFKNKQDPIFSDVFVARNPLVQSVGVEFQYCVKVDPSLVLGFASLVFLIFLPKNYYIDALIALYFLSFCPFTKQFAALFYAFFASFFIFIIFRQTQKHSISPTKMTDYFIPAGIALAALNALCSVIQFGFDAPFQLSQSPFTILVGMCIVQVVGLVAFSQFNVPIIFSFLGGLCVYLPFVLQIFLPIYYPQIEAVAISDVAAGVMSLIGIYCTIVSESLLERDDIVSEDVMGVIARETSSSSGDFVTIERDDSLKIGKVRRINTVSLVLSAIPPVIGVVAVFIANLAPVQPASFEIRPQNWKTA